MSRTRPLLTAAALLPLLLGCGERVAGSTTETENVLTAVVFSVDSLLPDRHLPSVATLRLDSSLVDFAATDSLGRDLVVERTDGAPLPFSVVYWDRKASLGRIQVRLDSLAKIPGSRIRLRWGCTLQLRSSPAEVWRGITAGEALALNSVEVDDFERPTLRSLLPDSASWYKGGSDSATVSLPRLDTAGLGRKGQAVRLSYAAPSATYQYALLGIALGKHPVNLRSLDSLVVWVRGSGNLAVAFDRLTEGDKGKAWMHTTLTPAWTRLRLRPQDLDTASAVGNNIGWEGVRHAVTNLTFLVDGGSELWIDDVRLHGIDRKDLE